MPKVSVIIAVYNGEKFLVQSINSILRQTYDNLELILVNDGSTDKSEDVIGAIDDPRIRYFKIKNTGSPSKPRNIGISNAEGEYIALCDQDDTWLPEKLEKQLEIFKLHQNDNVGLVAASANVVDSDNKVEGLLRIKKNGYLKPQIFFDNLLNENFITACSVLIRKDVFTNLGRFNEKLVGTDDYEMWLRISEKYGFYGIDEVLCSWRKTNESLSSDRIKIYESSIAILKRFSSGKNKEEVNGGISKFYLRLFARYLLKKDYKKAKESYKEATKISSVSSKAKFFFALFNISPSAAYLCYRIIYKINPEKV